MRTIFPFDEINTFKERLHSHFSEGRIKSEEDVEDIIDEILDLCLLAYANGVRYIAEEFNIDVGLEPTADELERVIYQEIDGETWEQRVRHWYEEGGTEADIVRIAETESHRVGNTAADEAAIQAGATTKTWVTMRDDRVRETHEYLEQTSVPIDSRFYTFDGDSARFPGDFTLAENNINCRCQLRYS